MKALYLEGREPLRVALDGPALRVSTPEKADRLFPLQRLGRIVVSGQVSWATDALLACADRAVPVSFLTRSGALRARVLGKPRAKPPLDLPAALDAFLETPEGPDRLRDWLGAEAQHARLRLARKLYGAPPSAGAGALRETLRAQARRYVPDESLDDLDRRLAGLLAAHLEAILGRAGLRPDAPMFVLQDLRLLRGFADVVGWMIQIDKLRFLWQRERIARHQNRPRVHIPRRAVTAFYESESSRIELEVARLLVRLHRYVLETVESDGD